MSNEAASLAKKLHLGIRAARAGQSGEARDYLNAVLQQDSENIPALFWLAFVSPSPQESIRLLKRVLALDPANEKAKAGIQWAQDRLEKAQVEIETQAKPEAKDATPVESQAPLAPTSEAASPRQKYLSTDTQEIAVKGPLAHRARRTFDQSASVLLVIAGALGILAATLGVLASVPTDTLAAWWPVLANPNPQVDHAPPALTFVQATTPAVKSCSMAMTQRLASETDTVRLETSGAVEEGEVFEAKSQGLSETAYPVPSNFSTETALASIDPTLFIGPEPASAGSQPSENLLLAHQPTYPDEKWIEVNVATQQITAWEGDVPIFSFSGSTGLPNTPTVLGEFNIYWKLESALMTGSGYYLPEVPYTMYFYLGYALHGAYWHNNFGQPMSHGCVNLEPGDAKMLFEWAEPVLPPGQTQVIASADNPGTLVVVHQ